MSESPELVLDGQAPVWRQIEQQVRRFVLGGELLPGEELPTVRSVAVALGVSPRAVERAYDRLERAGLVSRADAAGPVVARPPGGHSDNELMRLCEDFLRDAARRGHAPAAVLRACRACVEEEVRRGQAR
jgi:GntR family transcriptional regulator